jgi:excisionase family DNA binding protein
MNVFISTGKAAKLLGVTTATVIKLIKDGELTAWRTEGGHFRISEDEVRGFISKQATVLKSDQKPLAPAPADASIKFCWEYFAQEGELQEGCSSCIVYRARILNCFEMTEFADHGGFVGICRQSSCLECSYFRALNLGHGRMIVVSADTKFCDALRQEAGDSWQLLFTKNPYECSRMIGEFKPDLILVDCLSLGSDHSQLCSQMRSDERLIGTKIITARNRNLANTISLPQQ